MKKIDLVDFLFIVITLYFVFLIHIHMLEDFSYKNLLMASVISVCVCSFSYAFWILFKKL